MDVMLSDEEKDFKIYCNSFAKERLHPLRIRYGETDDIPQELVDTLVEGGFFKLLLPEKYGGEGIKAIRICLAREALAGVYCPADVTLAMQGLGSYPLVLAGNREQKETYLPKIGRGQLLATYALTEAEAGSDVNGMKSKGEETPGGFTLTGKKRFISNGNAADLVTVFVKTPLPESPRAISAFIIQKEVPGFTVSQRLEVIAPHDLVELAFDGCRVSDKNLLGKVGEGYRIAMKTLELFRMSVGAAAVGIGQTAFDAALTYAKQRNQFGSPIAKFQAVQFKLAEMATELDAARGLVYRAALLKDTKGPDVPRAASMAKWYATEAAFRAVDQAVQIHGGIGVLKGSTVERLYREIRAMRIYEGTTEIQKLIIANSLIKE